MDGVHAAKPKTFLTRANFVLHILRLFMVVFFLIYIIPSPENINDIGYRWCLITSVLLNLLEIGVQHGRPRFNNEYARELVLNYRTHYVFISALFLLHNPTFLILVPITLNEVGFIAHYIDSSLRQSSPERLERYDYCIDNFLGPLLT